jgi:hypothetical protein
LFLGKRNLPDAEATPTRARTAYDECMAKTFAMINCLKPQDVNEVCR